MRLKAPLPSKRTLEVIRDESIRALKASERAVEAQFHGARLVASLALGLVLVGFLLVAQWKGNVSRSGDLEAQSNQELAIIIQEMTGQNDALRMEVLRLEDRVRDADVQGKSTGAALNRAAKEVGELKVVAGLVDVVGPGIALRISDADRVLLPQDFVSIVHELRAGGAEVIAVNGRRLGPHSGFSGGDGVIKIDGMSVGPDYAVEAIGDPATLRQALEMPGGLKAMMSAYDGVTLSVSEIEEIKVRSVVPRTGLAGRPVRNR